MVALAARSSGRSTEISSQTKITTVMLEHDPEKWKPVFRKDHAQSKC
jgi:hypothetical protein